MKEIADLGLIGLAVMGQNLVLNMNDHGYTIAVYNRTTSKVDEFMQDAAKGRSTIVPAHSLEEFIASLKRPRKVMLMVKAGEVVDQFIDMLLPHLERGDIIIDGGNSHFPDSNRRTKSLQDKGILFVGTGVSGGEEGARFGPSIMPGGNPAAWNACKPIFQAIAAKTDSGEPCCDWVGDAGSGHYVKMVHNGIEYGDIQLIAEAYDLLHRGFGIGADELAEIFEAYRKTELDSYLIEIAADVFRHKDADGKPLLEKILDAAGQKGTGKWTAGDALEQGVPLTLIAEAVFARSLSSQKQERTRAAKILKGPTASGTGTSTLFADKKAFVEGVKDALLASKIVSYAQGFVLLREAAKTYGWNINFGNVALLWRGGCIIRSVFLGDIKKAFDRSADLENLMLDDYFAKLMARSEASWRKVCAQAQLWGVPVPAFSSALAYYDGYRSDSLPANLIQALRDYFGAHTYERTDKPRGQFFHTNWTGTGGNVSSSTYNA